MACNEITDPSDTDNLNEARTQEIEGSPIESLGIYFDADGEYVRSAATPLWRF